MSCVHTLAHCTSTQLSTAFLWWLAMWRGGPLLLGVVGGGWRRWCGEYLIATSPRPHVLATPAVAASPWRPCLMGSEGITASIKLANSGSAAAKVFTQRWTRHHEGGLGVPHRPPAGGRAVAHQALRHYVPRSAEHRDIQGDALWTYDYDMSPCRPV